MHILITGGSGLIGRQLTDALLNKGYQVSHLSRSQGKHKAVQTFLWDVDKGYIDEHCLEGVDAIIHLAGAGIADKLWTRKRKQVLINSRTASIALIYNLMRQKANQVKTVISASGTGYYNDRGDQLLTETSNPANDFLGECCVLWEQAVDAGAEFALRIVKFRTGVVLDTKGGALPKLAGPVKYGFGTVLGSGKQWVPWVHRQDVIDMYLYALENESISGVYNMVSPNPVTNQQLTKAIARQLHKPLWLPKVPAFALKMVLGEMSQVVLSSTKVSADKIKTAGFAFKYTVLEDALRELYG